MQLVYAYCTYKKVSWPGTVVSGHLSNNLTKFSMRDEWSNLHPVYFGKVGYSPMNAWEGLSIDRCISLRPLVHVMPTQWLKKSGLALRD